MKVIAWYAIALIAFKIVFALWLLIEGDTIMFVFGIITVVFEIPVLLMAVWFIRGKIKKAFAWYTEILYSLIFALVFVAISQQGISWTPIIILVLHSPMFYFATRIIRLS